MRIVIMKRGGVSSLCLAVLVVGLALGGCAGPGEPSEGSAEAAGTISGQALTASAGQGSVTVMQGSRRVAVCRAAEKNIVRTRFVHGQKGLAVKSRGERGSSTVQLFNARTGAEIERVMGFEIRDGWPAWAAGMAD
mgnify:CR=1 FL=1